VMASKIQPVILRGLERVIVVRAHEWVGGWRSEAPGSSG